MVKKCVLRADMKCPFVITDLARDHILEMLKKEPAFSMFKLSVLENKGCFGLKYMPSLEKDKSDDDLFFEYDKLLKFTTKS